MPAASRKTRELTADVVVVGAGMAGLSAARTLAARGLDVLALEARNRAGGRLESIEVGDFRYDVGGQWVGPTQDRLYALAHEFDAQTFPTHIAGENVIELDGKLTRYTGTIPRLGPHVIADVGQALLKISRMARKVSRDAPWQAPKAQAWDSQTTWSWMRRNMATRNGRKMVEVAVKAVWAAMPADVSLLHLLFYISSAGNFDLLLDTGGGAQQDRFVDGAGTLARRVGESLGERLVTNAPVKRIEHSEEGVTVSADGIDVRGKRAIVAVPPTLAGRIHYDPPLSGYRDQLTQRFPMGSVIKCLAFYDEPFWRKDGLSGEAIAGSGPLTMIFDNSPPDGSCGVLVGFLEGHWARELGRVTDDERRRAVIDNLSRIFGQEAADPDHYVDKSWAEERWSRGCYTGYTSPGTLTAFGPAIREPIGPIHWAGTETATVWNGYIDGAIQSGERVAGEVIAAL